MGLYSIFPFYRIEGFCASFPAHLLALVELLCRLLVFFASLPPRFSSLPETKQMENNDWWPSAVQRFHRQHLTLLYKTRPNERLIPLPVNNKHHSNSLEQSEEPGSQHFIMENQLYGLRSGVLTNIYGCVCVCGAYVKSIIVSVLSLVISVKKIEWWGCKLINLVTSSKPARLRIKVILHKVVQKNRLRSMKASGQNHRFLSWLCVNDSRLASVALNHSLVSVSVPQIPKLEIRLSICQKEVDRKWLFI